MYFCLLRTNASASSENYLPQVYTFLIVINKLRLMQNSFVFNCLKNFTPKPNISPRRVPHGIRCLLQPQPDDNAGRRRRQLQIHPQHLLQW